MLAGLLWGPGLGSRVSGAAKADSEAMLQASACPDLGPRSRTWHLGRGDAELRGPAPDPRPLRLPVAEWKHRPGHRQAPGLHLRGGHAEGGDGGGDHHDHGESPGRAGSRPGFAGASKRSARARRFAAQLAFAFEVVFPREVPLPQWPRCWAPPEWEVELGTLCPS